MLAGALSFVTDSTAAFSAAQPKLAKALSSAPDHALGHVWLGLADMFTRRAAQGIAECEYALELDRNLASADAAIGFGKILIGRAEETEGHIAEALRLSPRDTLAYMWMHIAVLQRTTSAVGNRRSRGIGGRLTLTEITRLQILCCPPLSRSLVGLTRRIPQ